MRNLFLLLLFLPLAFAAQLTAGNHKDYTWDYAYGQPQPLQDILNSSDCGQLIGNNDCNVIMNSNFSDERKRWLIIQTTANGIDPQNYSSNWNDRIQFGRYAPENTAVYNGPVIKNTWTRLVSISPSITDLDNKTWIPKDSELRIEKNIEMVAARINDSGACSINYNIIGYDYALETFVDGALYSNSDRVQLHINKPHGEPVQITTKLSFVADYEIEVSHWYTVDTCDEGCYETRCGHPHYIQMHDEGSVSDSKLLYSYDDSASAATFMKRTDDGAKGWLAVSMPEGKEIEFDAGGTKYVMAMNSYQLSDIMRPYDILSVSIASNATHSVTLGMSAVATLSKDGVPLTKQSRLFNGIVEMGNNLLIGYETSIIPTDCALVFRSHFSEKSIPIICEMSGYAPLLNITISNSTNQSILAMIRFYDNNPEAPFVGKELNVFYDSKTMSATTDQNGTTVLMLNRTSTGSFLAVSFETDAVVPDAQSKVFVSPKDLDINVVMLTDLAAGIGAMYFGVRKVAMMFGGFV